MIEIDGLSKDYGRVSALQSVSFGVEAGSVVGFLGRNGAGKSTTLRILAGLTAASGGSAKIAGAPYRDLKEPQRTVGFGLDAETFYGALSGRPMLSLVAARGGIGRRRIREVLKLVELSAAADRAVGGYSLGLRLVTELEAAGGTVERGDPGTLLVTGHGEFSSASLALASSPASFGRQLSFVAAVVVMSFWTAVMWLIARSRFRSLDF